MIERCVSVAIAVAFLSGCSYDYHVLAKSEGGRVVFLVDSNSRRTPDCIRRIAIGSSDPRVLTAGPDGSQDRYSWIWRDSVDYKDACRNRFPVTYGHIFEGKKLDDDPPVAAQKLIPGVVYEIDATTRATGYGSGKFLIHPNGEVENVAS